MAAPVLTVFGDAAPCPRVEVFFPSFVAGTVSVTVFRLSGGREFQVRGAVRAATAGSLSRIDFEVPFNEPVSYRAEQFGALGVSLGFTPTTTLGDAYSPWVEVARNRHTNPDLLVDLAGWGHFGGAAALATTRVAQPSGELNLTRPGAVANFAATADGIASAYLGDAIPVVEGESISASFYMRRGTGWTGTGTPRLDWSNGARALGAVQSISQGVYDRFIVSAVVPAGVTTARLNVLVSAMATGNVFRARMAQINSGSVAAEYMDGNTPNEALAQWRWLAAVGASASVKEVRTVSGVGVQSDVSWMHNPLDPQGSVRVIFGDDTAWTITRPTPGVISHPKGRRVGVVLSEPRQGVTGLRVTIRTSSDTDADKVQAMAGDNGRPPIVCIRLGGDDKRTRVPQPLFLSALTVEEIDMNHRWGGNELAHRFDGDEVAPPIPGLIVPLLRAKDINVSFATALAVNTGHLKAADVNRRYDLAGAAG